MRPVAGLAAQEPARHTPDLAHSLHNLGICLRDAERYQEALARFEEAVTLGRDLVAQESTWHTPSLAIWLTNSAITLCEFGQHDEELELRAEATVRWGILSQLDPDEHEDTYQRARDQLAASFSKHGHEPDVAWRTEEALAHRLGLGMPPPQRST